MMKKEMCLLKKCLLSGIVLVFLFTPFGVAQQDETRIQMEKQLEKLKQKLQLSDRQAAAVKQILQEAQIQKDTDRETYQGDALALIQAGWDRKKNIDAKIEPLLSTEQLEEYRDSGKMDPVERELFELTEGLGLTADQAFDVEGILIQLDNEFGQFRDRMEPMGEGDRPPGPPGGGGFGPGGGPGGMLMGPGGNPGKIMKAREAKKDKAIKKILTEEQKVLYQQIKEDREKKMKQMQEEMKKKMKDKTDM